MSSGQFCEQTNWCQQFKPDSTDIEGTGNWSFIARSSPDFRAKFALINVRSIRNKALLVRDYIDERELDVFALTETWLGEDETTAVSELCGMTSRSYISRVVALAVVKAWEFCFGKHYNSFHVPILTPMQLRHVALFCATSASAVPCA